MFSRRAKIVACACTAACAAVWWNVLYLQHGTRPELLARTQRLGETASRPSLSADRTASGSRDRSLASLTLADKPRAQPAAADSDADVVRAIQRELEQRGYQPGLADGLAHSVTRAAVMAYEYDHGLPLTGEPSEALLKAILFGIPGNAGPKGASQPSPEAQRIIRLVQQGLAALGYQVGTIDGRLSEETTKAIRKFEAAQGLPPSGRVSAPLLARLNEATLRQQRKSLTQ
jgi:peptidoglycan hydrolase-like protein with peptidoglycan-binding domain